MSDMETIVSLAKRRGFIFQSSEIYGGLASTWDYGPLGVELKNNVKAHWWRTFVHGRDDMVGLDASILMARQVWAASGHEKGFSDPLVDCRACKQRFRADHLMFWKVHGTVVSIGVPTPPPTLLGVLGEVNPTGQPPSQEIEDMETRLLVQRGFSSYETQPKQIPLGINSLSSQERAMATCPDCRTPGSLTEPRQFNLMFKTFLGPVEDDTAQTYLRPETAQGIFVNFNNVPTTPRRKLPFGIAQVGKAFRNEITVGNFIFRTREFEQMEIEFFVKPGTDDDWHQRWIEDCKAWYTGLGIAPEHLRVRQHEASELAHSSKATSDIEYAFPWGWGEIQGIANRTDFDLSAHSKASGKDLNYFNEEAKEHFIPYVIEPSAGVDRALLAFLLDAYHEEEAPTGEGKTETRVVLKLHPALAPIKVAVLPLSRNERLVPKAREVYDLVRKNFVCQYDDAQSIGRRYRRQDEVGTPLCVTVDFQTIEQDNAVTIRDRDTMQQVRVSIADLMPALRERLPMV